MTADMNLKPITWEHDALPTWLPITYTHWKIAKNKPFLEAQFKTTRLSNATLGGSTIYQGQGLWKKTWKPKDLALWENSSAWPYHPLIYHASVLSLPLFVIF
jgi:hypothetical protein